MKKSFVAFTLIFISAAVFSQSAVKKNYDVSRGKVKLEFKYKKDDSFRILSTVNENVYVNKRLDHVATIINRITSRVTEVSEDGSGTLECNFMTSESSRKVTGGTPFTYGEDYESVFTRSRLGVYEIVSQYFMPVVRDCPVFPDREVSPGECWTYEGHEAHDMRQIFGLNEPFKVPFTATYTYLGMEDNFHVISVRYDLYTETQRQSMYVYEYPVEMAGFSDQTVYFDNEKGIIDHYTENFRIYYTTNLGQVLDFKGTAHAETDEFTRVNTEEHLNSVQKKVDEMGIENVTVKQDEKGLTLSIENIKFKAESAELMESEKMKLDQIALILQAYPDNDILISGHTAYANNGVDPQLLSEKRAEAVAEYLIKLGVKDVYHIFVKGFGATRPVAPNTTEKGKAKNRRVEITILDK